MVKAVQRGTAGSAGELRGDFDLTRDLGDLYANTAGGVFGTLEDPACFSGEAIPVGVPEKGKAVIRSNVQGDTVEGRMAPLEKGISCAVSTSVMPCPSAPKAPVCGS